MLKRSVEEQIRDFLQGQNKALLVTGARQVGKTFSIRKVSKECFENVVEINFVERPDALEIFNIHRGAKDILLRLSSFSKKPMIPGKTLIFFDEVQECKEMVTAIKFLVDDGDYKYVMSGSLLGIELDNLRSVPVGYMDVIEMFPLDLEEFFDAIGVNENVMAHLRKCYNDRIPVDNFIHEKLLEAVRLYLIVGGMPAVVQRYLDTNNLREVNNEQRSIIRNYKKDISKYDPKHKLQIGEIYDLIPSELNSKNKRFILKELNEKARFRKYEESFLWLKDAGVAIPVYNAEDPRVPLLLSKQRNLFKLFLNDVGLLAAMYGGNIQSRLLNLNSNINFGSVFENLVAQELYAHGFTINGEHALYYFNSKKQGEIDFIIEYEGNVLPIEVKSGKDYERHNALCNVMANEEYNVPSALVFCQDNVQTKGRITYLPIYMVTFLRKENAADVVYRLDLSDLNV